MVLPTFVAQRFRNKDTSMKERTKRVGSRRSVPKTVSAKEAAAILGCHKKHITHLLRIGRLKGERIVEGNPAEEPVA